MAPDKVIAAAEIPAAAFVYTYLSYRYPSLPLSFLLSVFRPDPLPDALHKRSSGKIHFHRAKASLDRKSFQSP